MARFNSQILPVVGLAVLLTACGRQVPDERWVAEGVGTDVEARYEAAADYSRDHDGLAFLVYERGELVYSSYQDGFKPDDATLIYSGTKSFSCALTVAAIDDGLLDGFDENVSQTLSAWADDPRKSKITVRHMLQFVTGLEKSFGAINFGFADDKYRVAIERAAEHDPGSYYLYDPVHLTTFGAFFLQKTGEDPVDYMERRIFKPIGMTYVDWKRDDAGHPFLSRGAKLTADNWAKFGHLIKDRGAYGGEQILNDALLQECFEAGPDFPGYGMTWWMNVPIGTWADRIPNDQVPIDPLDQASSEAMMTPRAPADLIAAAGHKDNRLYISRSADLVVVRLGDGDRNFRDSELLERFFP